MIDITQLFGKVEEAQKKMEALKQQLTDFTITKETGAGLVKATVNGEKQLLALSIDKTLFSEENQSMIEDLVIGAVNLALEEVNHKVQEMVQDSALQI